MEFAIPVTCYLSGRFTLYKGHSQWDTNTHRNWKMKLNYENCVMAHNLNTSQEQYAMDFTPTGH
jgi:hypothetical protein